MAIDKYSGLSQTQKFHARYGKSIGKQAVARQQTHLALEAHKSKLASQLQLPNYAASAPKPQLKLPNLVGGIYDTAGKKAAESVARPKVSKKFIEKMLKKIASDPKFNWRAADLTPEQIAAIEARLGKSTAQAATETGLVQVVKNTPATTSSNVAEGIKKVAQAATSDTPNLLDAIKPESGAAGAAGSGAGAASGATSNLPAVIKKGGVNLPAAPVKPEPAADGAKGLLGRLKAFASTKKGKIGLAAAALTALVAGGIYLYNRNKEKPDPVSNSSPSNDLANAPVNGQMTANGPYTVAKGDNVWNIARANLMELHKGEADYKPTDVQILQRTEEIMQLNDLHYEKDNYRVIIQPNQSLKLTA